MEDQKILDSFFNDEITTKIISGNVLFALKMFRLYQSDDVEVFSPLSLMYALAMARAGIHEDQLEDITKDMEIFLFENDPISEEEIEVHIRMGFADLLSHLNREENLTNLTVTNGVFEREDLAATIDYLASLKTYYKAFITAVDFEDEPEITCEAINEWIVEKTNGLMSNLVSTDHFNSRTKLVLLNIFHFKGSWACTRSLSYPPGATPTTYTCRDVFPNYYSDTLLCTFVQIKYTEERFSMIIVQPDIYYEHEELINVLTPDLFKIILENLVESERTIIFKQSTNRYIQRYKDSPLETNFDYVNSDGNIVQHVYVRSDAEGTEAIALTILNPKDLGDSVVRRDVKGSLFIIYDKLVDAILFMGQISVDLGR